MENGGAEKYYLALVEGSVQVPSQQVWKSPDWMHGRVAAGNKLPGEPSVVGRIEVAMEWDPHQSKSLAWNDGTGASDILKVNNEHNE